MKKFWERKIVEKDPTPVINLTDLASQVALTYMTYGVDKFAE